MKLVRAILTCWNCDRCKGVNSWNCSQCSCSKTPPAPRR